MYDSKEDTLKHRERVYVFLNSIRYKLGVRGLEHDGSKLQAPEKEVFDRITPKLKGLTYGSKEYKDSLKEMGTALEHHYKNNSHHPEYYDNGILDMSLIDIIEMLADWKAATLRHANGDIRKSLEINKKRFEIPESLYQILQNTIDEMGW